MSAVLSEQECLVCDRVGVGQFYRELRQFGFKREVVLKILKCMATLYFKDPILMAGKSRITIKCAITYVCATYLDYRITQREISEFFHIHESKSPELSSHASFAPLYKVIISKYLPVVEQVLGYVSGRQ